MVEGILETIPNGCANGSVAFSSWGVNFHASVFYPTLTTSLVQSHGKQFDDFMYNNNLEARFQSELEKYCRKMAFDIETISTKQHKYNRRFSKLIKFHIDVQSYDTCTWTCIIYLFKEIKTSMTTIQPGNVKQLSTRDRRHFAFNFRTFINIHEFNLVSFEWNVFHWIWCENNRHLNDLFYIFNFLNKSAWIISLIDSNEIPSLVW